MRTVFQRAFVYVGIGVFILLSVVPAIAQRSGGRRFALVIGVNRYPYLPKETQLEWAVADANSVRKMLIDEFNFSSSNIVPLYNTDATRSAILSSLRRALSQVRAGDVFVLYYSGHGTLFPDSKSEVIDETQVIEEVIDGKTQRLRRLIKPGTFDSAICPSDVAGPSTSGKGWGNLILDDELFDFFTEFTRKGCEVILLADSCNSGSLARSMSDGGSDRTKGVPPGLALGNNWEDIPTPSIQREVARTASDMNGRFIAFTAAKDHQLAWESQDGGGYFTQALVSAASGTSNIATFECLFRAVKRTVKLRKSIQEPQMDTRFFSSAPTNTLFMNYSAPTRLKVLVKIMDTAGNYLPGATFVVLRKGVAPKAQIEESDALLLGRSDFGGLYDSGCPQVDEGAYWVIAMKGGYKVYEEKVTIAANAPGVAVLRIRLAKL